MVLIFFVVIFVELFIEIYDTRYILAYFNVNGIILSS